MKVFVVEDTENSRILLEEILISENHEVDSAANGYDALQKISKNPPDLIISDILMPVMDGFELCRQLKAIPELVPIPFIFYTATYTDARDEKFAMSLGASRFVVKPKDPIKLINIINDVIADPLASKVKLSDNIEIENNVFESNHSKVLSAKLNKKIHDLENQKAQLKIITDAVPALIAELDENNYYQYVNSAYEKWFAVSREAIIGKSVKDVAGEAIYDLTRPYIEKALNGEEAVYEGYIQDINGNNRYIVARYIPHINPDTKVRHCFSFINDFTEQKQSEDDKQKLLIQLRQSQKMDAVGHLAGGIAHDFNNILSIILGYADLSILSKFDNKDGNIENNINQIRIAGLRGQDLVSQIMKFSRKSDEQLEFSVDIKPLVKEVIKLVEETFPATVIIDEELEDNVPAIVIELTLLHQVLVNLLVNSRDAIDGHGRIVVKLSQEQVKDVVCNSCKQPFTGDFVVLSISDNGAGIDAKDLDEIFNLFYTTKEVGKGTGLGLSMVHDIVHESRGHILIESVVEQGTTFKIFFSVSELKEKTPEDNEVNIIADKNVDCKSTIMVVDDEVPLAHYLKELLSNNGYQVNMFTDSQEALQAFQANPDAYDLVVTDQLMPHMTGDEMAEKMLQLHSSLPVIICSGNHTLSSDFIKKLGIKKLLQKPVSARDLLHEIKSLINN